MKLKYWTIIIVSIVLCACSIFNKKPPTTNDKQISRPPQKTQASDGVVAVNQQGQQNKNNASQGTVDPKTKPRIEEYRGAGGTVSKIKVNNQKLPPYYLNPNSDVVDSNGPSSDVVTPPHWQVTW